MAGRMERSIMGGGGEAEPFYGPRAATTDAARGRSTSVILRRLLGTPGVAEGEDERDQSDDVYAQGLESFLRSRDGINDAEDLEGAVKTWATIPKHPEARQGMRRILQQVRGRQ